MSRIVFVVRGAALVSALRCALTRLVVEGGRFESVGLRERAVADA